jgi:hypothetical protein
MTGGAPSLEGRHSGATGQHDPASGVTVALAECG